MAVWCRDSKTAISFWRFFESLTIDINITVSEKFFFGECPEAQFLEGGRGYEYSLFDFHDGLSMSSPFLKPQVYLDKFLKDPK